MKRRGPDYAEMVTMKIAGKSYGEIADHFHLLQSTTHYQLAPDREVVRDLWRRAHDRCEECRIPFKGRIRRSEVHHRLDVPRTVETYNALGALQYLCRRCHTTKHGWNGSRLLRWRSPPPVPLVTLNAEGFPAQVNGVPVHCTEPPVTVAGLTWYYLKATEGKAHWQWCHETGQSV